MAFRSWLMLAVGVFVGACSPVPSAAVKPTASPAATVAPTAVPTVAPTAVIAKPTAGPDYAQLRRDLVIPLGALIVATRENSGRANQHLAAFNEVAARIEPAIAGDMSVNANRLHSGIVNVRDAAARKDLAELERIRLNLLEVR